MAKSTKITKSEYKKMLDKLYNHIEEAYAAIKGLSTNAKKLMDGDSEGPYWNGILAKKFYNTIKGNLQNDITAYKEAADAYTALAKKYIKIVEAGKKSI